LKQIFERSFGGVDRSVFRFAVVLLFLTFALAASVAVFASKKHAADQNRAAEREIHKVIGDMQRAFNSLFQSVNAMTGNAPNYTLLKAAVNEIEKTAEDYDSAVLENAYLASKSPMPVAAIAQAQLAELLQLFQDTATASNGVVVLQSLHDDVLISAQDFSNRLNDERLEIDRALNSGLIVLGSGLGLVIFVLSIMVAKVLISARRQKYHYQYSVEVQGNLRAVIEASLDAVIVFGKSGNVLEFNSSAERILHIEKKNVLGKSLSRVLELSLENSPMDTAQDKCMLITLGPGRYIANARRSDGSSLPVEVGISETRGGSGQELKIAYLRDLTSQKKREAALEQAKDDALKGERAKSRFLAVVSHEMRTPLNGLLAGVELLKATSELTDRQKWLADVIQDSGKNALDQVDNVLEMTRLEGSQGSDEDRAVFRPSIVIEQIISEVAASASLQGNTVTFKNVGVFDPVVAGTELLFRRIVQNLLKNANKFTQDGQVNVVLEAGGPETDGKTPIKVSIEDTGIGISYEHQERIFRDFEAVDSSFSRRADGAGLGLSISKRAAEAMTGRIHLVSKINEGSTFTFSVNLPVADENDLIAAELQDESEVKSLDILVVEDNNVNRDMLCEILELEGHSVAEAENGKEAVDIANDIHFDVILMDISMPVMDGLEATRQIRAEGRFPDTPIIGVTAHALPEQVERFVQTGMNEVVLKPISIGAISKVLAKFRAGKVTMSDDYTLHGASSPTEMDPTFVDQDTYGPLLEILGADAVRGYVQQFLDDFDAVLPEVKALHANGQGEEAATTAHKIAGSAAVLGAAGARSLLISFEDASRSGDLEKCDRLLVEIENLKGKIGPVLMPK